MSAADDLDVMLKLATSGKPSLYPPRPIKARATNDEMEVRAAFLIAYAIAHSPVTVRGLYYQAEVHGLPGIDKTEHSYKKIQHQVLQLRRSGRLGYQHIADATRWMRRPTMYGSLSEAVGAWQSQYRRDLWRDAPETCEIWCEKDAVSGTIYPVTAEYGVPLMVTRGFSSESFAYEAIAQRGDDRRPLNIYYLGDFDRSGEAAGKSLNEKLSRFAREKGITVNFQTLAVTLVDIHTMRLPTREPKRLTAADKKWPFDFACELDAVAPDAMRAMVRNALSIHMPLEMIQATRAAEESEKLLLDVWGDNLARRSGPSEGIHPIRRWNRAVEEFNALTDDKRNEFVDMLRELGWGSSESDNADG